MGIGIRARSGRRRTKKSERFIYNDPPSEDGEVFSEMNMFKASIIAYNLKKALLLTFLTVKASLLSVYRADWRVVD